MNVPLLLHSLSFYCWAQRHPVWSISLVSLVQLSWLCPLPTSCPPPAHWPLGWSWRGSLDAPTGSTGQQRTTHWCLINSVTATNTKHSTMRAAIKKVNFIPARPSTHIQNIPRNSLFKNGWNCIHVYGIWLGKHYFLSPSNITRGYSKLGNCYFLNSFVVLAILIQIYINALFLL